MQAGFLHHDGFVRYDTLHDHRVQLQEFAERKNYHRHFRADYSPDHVQDDFDGAFHRAVLVHLSFQVRHDQAANFAFQMDFYSHGDRFAHPHCRADLQSRKDTNPAEF